VSKETTQEQAARRIQALLANAESAAKDGNEALRDTYLEKASALQMQYAIDAAMLRTGAVREEIVSARFCEESNTPLVKAKRDLINMVAKYNRGHAVLTSAMQPDRNGNLKMNRRAYMEVFAHESDLRFITSLYTSLILQMQSMMANDERALGKVPANWRVSYAHAWVNRVCQSLREINTRQSAAAEQKEAGTALVLRDRSAAVDAHLASLYGGLRKASVKRSAHNVQGAMAGRLAGANADLGQKKVQN
jgi:RNase P subunit RPR2